MYLTFKNIILSYLIPLKTNVFFIVFISVSTILQLKYFKLASDFGNQCNKEITSIEKIGAALSPELYNQRQQYSHRINWLKTTSRLVAPLAVKRYSSFFSLEEKFPTILFTAMIK